MELFRGGSTSLGTTTADGSGSWSLTPGSALSDGSYTVTAKATDVAGNTSSAMSGLSITIDTSAPSAPSTPDLTAGTDSGSSSSDDETNDNTPTFTGTSEAFATVELFRGGSTSLGTTAAIGVGFWSLTPGSALSDGSYTITAKATDVAGNTSSSSSGLSITIDTTAPTVSALSPADDSVGLLVGVNFVLTFSETVVTGTGNITLNNLADDQALQTIDVTGGQMSGSGTNTITIDPSQDLTPGVDYYIQIPSTAFLDQSGNPYAGIADKTSWNVAPSDRDGTVTAGSGVSEPVILPTSANSTGSAVNIFDFAIADGGSADNLPLGVTQLVLHTSGTGPFDKVVFRLNGPDVNNATGAYDSGASTLTFSALNISVAHGQSETYTVSAYFSDNTGLTDNQTLLLSLDGDVDLNLVSTGTLMSGSNGAVDNGSGSTVDVTATRLVFTAQPATSILANANMGSMTLQAQDAAGNLDLDFAQTVTLTDELQNSESDGPGDLLSTDAGGLSKNAAAGQVSWSDLRYNAAAPINIQATSVSFSVESANIAVQSVDNAALTASSGVSEPVRLPSTANSVGAAVNIFDFALTDGDSDGLALQVVWIALHTSGTGPFDKVVFRLNGPDANQVTGTYSSSANKLTFAVNITVASGSSEAYTVNAYYSDNTGLTENQTLVLSVDGDTDLSLSPYGTQMGSTSPVDNGSGSAVDITATQLVFTQQPASLAAVSGTSLDFSTDPVVEARDAFDNKDADFADTVTLTETGNGTATYTNNAVSAVAGVATFTNMTVEYTATTNGESFALRPDDTSTGAEGDIATLPTSSSLTAAAATNGALTAGSGVSEPVPLPSTASSAGAAVNTFDFTLVDGTPDGLALQVSQVVLHTSGTGPFAKGVFRLNGPDVSQATGTYDSGTNTLTFSNLVIEVADGLSETYTINAYYSNNTGLTDGQTLLLSLDGDADLTVSTAGTQMSGSHAAVDNGSGSPVEVTATQLVLTQAPADSRVVDTGNDEVVSGLTFQTQPRLEARDAVGNLDLTFADPVSVSLGSGGGSLNGTVTASPLSGVIAFTDLSYAALQDGESFALAFDDQAGGSEGDLPAASTSGLSADVIATGLTFTAFPGLVQSNQDLTVVPRVQAQDAQGQVDTDFTGTVTLTANAGTLNNGQVQATAGEAAFAGLVLSGAGTGRSLTASSAGVNSITTSPFEVSKTTAGITFSDFVKVYDGQPQSVRVFTTPSGLSVRVSYNGVLGEPVGPGTFQVEATVVDDDYAGSAQVTLTIEPPPPPQIAAIGARTAAEDEVLTIDLSSFDTQKGSWSVGSVDSELISATAVEGDLIRFTPVANASGSAVVEITRTNLFDASSAQQVELNWTPVNDPPGAPVAVRPGDDQREVDLAPVLEWKAEDIDGDALVYAVFLGTDENALPLLAGELRTTSHSLERLSPQTRYFWRVVAQDVNGAQAEGRFSFVTQQDQNAPLISNLDVAATEDGAVLSWTTNEAATSRVEFTAEGGQDQAIDADDSGEAFVERHRVTLHGLTSGTEYAYTVRSADRGGLFAEVSRSFFTLAEVDGTPPAIQSGPVVQQRTDRTATIAWTTDEPASSQVRYAPEGTALEEGKTASSTSFVEQHQVVLNELEPGTAYVFQVWSSDVAGNASERRQGRFQTEQEKDERAPAFLSGPNLQQRADRTATIGWRSDESATAEVRFHTGEDLADGQAVKIDAFQEAHEAGLGGLEPETRYFYQVTLRDAAGNERASSLLTFETKAAADRVAPRVLTGPGVVGLSATTASVALTSSEPATGRIVVRDAATDGVVEERLIGELKVGHQFNLIKLSPDTEYGYEVHLRDAAGNDSAPFPGSFRTEAEADTRPPVLRAVSVDGVSDRAANVSWGTDEPADSRLRYGISLEPGEVRELAVAKLNQVHQFLLTGLHPETAYLFEVVSQDASGNPSAAEKGSFTTLPAPDTDPPLVLTGPGVEDPRAETATVSWTTDEPAFARLRYGTAADLSDAEAAPTDPSTHREHRIGLAGLTPDTEYFYSIELKDLAGNPATASGRFTTAALADDRAPVFLQQPTAVSVGDRTGTVTWETDEPAAGQMRVGRTQQLADARRVDVLALNRRHTLELTNLEVDTEYFFQVEVRDAAGNAAKSAVERLRTRPAPDTQKPRIAAGPITRDVGAEWATVFVRADEQTQAEVRFAAAVDGATGRIAPSAVPGREHQIALTNLEPGTEYRYTVLLKDGAGLVTVSEEKRFTTEQQGDSHAPRLLGPPAVEDLKSTQARIEWVTDEPADSRVDFGTTDALEIERIDLRHVRNHAVTLTNLLPGTGYRFRVASTDPQGNGPIESDVLSFTTPEKADQTPPRFVRAPMVKDLTDRTLTLAFETDEVSTAQVRYGLTAALELAPVELTDLEDRHDAVLEGLLPGTVYFAQVAVRDAVGNGPTESDLLQTTTQPEADNTPPHILEDPVVTKVTQEEAVIRWTVDEPADGQVAYTGPDGRRRTVTDPERRREHVLVVTNLAPGTTYSFTVQSTDAVGNGPMESAPGSFTTTQTADTRAPTIFSGPTVDASENRATIRWETDEPAHSAVEYGNSTAYGTRIERVGLVTRHEIDLTDLVPGTTYHFAVFSADIAQNEVSTHPGRNTLHGVDHTFTTRQVGDRVPPRFTVFPRFESVSDRTAVISWETDESATTEIAWASPSPGAGGGRRADNALTRQHAVTLTNLQPRTQYAMRIVSRDAAGNELAYGAPRALIDRLQGGGTVTAVQFEELRAKLVQQPTLDAFFVTDSDPDQAPPVIVRTPHVIERTHESLVVEWETDEPTDGLVRFGTTPELGETVTSSRDERVHRITLTQLQPGQIYYLKARSTDPSGNGPVESALLTERTAHELDLTPPLFTQEPAVLSATETRLELAWETDEPADALVTYAAAEGETRTLWLGERQTRRALSLSDLEPGTDYTIQVKVADAGQNAARSQELAGTTATEPDQTPPSLSEPPRVVHLTDRQATVAWETDEPAVGEVFYGSTVYLGEAARQPEEGRAHRVSLTNLKPDTRYIFRVRVTDRADNSSRLSATQVFTTPAERDTVPPTAPAELAAEPGGTEARLRWSASPAADLGGYNLYRAEGDGPFARLASQVRKTDFFDQNLLSGAIYRYKVTAVDDQSPPNESAFSPETEILPLTELAPTAPRALQAETGSRADQPVLVAANARPVGEEDELSYIFQISSDSRFADVVQRRGGVAEGLLLTRWVVPMSLGQGERLWWRVRAYDGRFHSPWSAGMPLALEGLVSFLNGDFNLDGIVNFEDFFLLADRFGGDLSSFDLNFDGVIDMEDFRLFVDQFGKQVASKRAVSRRHPAAPLGALRLEADEGDGGQIAVRLRADGLDGVRGYGITLRYDPEAAEFAGFGDSTGTLVGRRQERMALVREIAPGWLAIAEHRRADGTAEYEGTLLAQLRFSLKGEKEELRFEVEDGLLGFGGEERLEIVERLSATVLPRVYALGLNYPNPFNPQTTIPVAIPAGDVRDVSLRIYNVAGQVVRDLSFLVDSPGYHYLVWDGEDRAGRPAASGVYLVRLEAGAFRQTRKILLIE